MRRRRVTRADWISSVILRDYGHIDPSRLESALRKRFDERDGYHGFERDEKNDFVMFRVGGGTAIVALMNYPIPNGELDSMCRHAWY